LSQRNKESISEHGNSPCYRSKIRNKKALDKAKWHKLETIKTSLTPICKPGKTSSLIFLRFVKK